MGAAVLRNAFGIVVEYGLENQEALQCIFIPWNPKQVM